VGSLFRIQVGVIQPESIFGIHRLSQVQKLLLSDVLQRDHIMGIQRITYTEKALMKQVFP